MTVRATHVKQYAFVYSEQADVENLFFSEDSLRKVWICCDIVLKSINFELEHCVVRVTHQFLPF